MWQYCGPGNSAATFTRSAIPIGRTNLPDFGLRVHTDSALHGLTRNPWNPERTAGGSRTTTSPSS
ncbi:MAG TPA: amidase family protein [Streptosporangiaceae bacterium]